MAVLVGMGANGVMLGFLGRALPTPLTLGSYLTCEVRIAICRDVVSRN